jgi:hypothetical protein
MPGPTDLFKTYTFVPGGAFPGHYADDGNAGYHIRATTTERNAIPAYLRKAGMLCFVQAGAGTLWQLKASPWANNDTDWLPFSSGLSRVTYDLLQGNVTTDLQGANPLAIGAVHFDPNTIIPVSSGRTRHVDLEIVLESASLLYFARFDLYDVAGISTGGTPGVVANSLKQTNAIDATRLTQNLDAELGAITTAGLLEGRLYVSAMGYATCKLARLVVTWD